MSLDWPRAVRDRLPRLETLWYALPYLVDEACVLKCLDLRRDARRLPVDLDLRGLLRKPLDAARVQVHLWDRTERVA